MNAQEIISVISTLGFPIVCTIAIYRSLMQFMTTFNDKLTEIMKLHAEESKSMQKSLDDNTAVIQRLLDRIGDDNHE